MAEIEADRSDLPFDQLRLVHDELNRQRERARAASTSMQYRASVLIAAAAIVAGLRGVSHSTMWDVAAGSASLIAAALGLIAVRATAGQEILISKFHDAALNPDVDAFSAEFGLVRDKMLAHDVDVRALGHRRVLVNTGFVVLAFAWVLEIAAFAFRAHS